MTTLEDTSAPDDYDTPWKEIINDHCQEFVRFFLPQAYHQIDWEKGYEILDNELAQLTRDAQTGRRTMDKLVKVWQKDGSERIILIHIEIQGEPQPEFPKRMFTYLYRAMDSKQLPVVGLAILTDDQKNWRPHQYQFELWGSTIVYRFNMVKLIDYAANLEELEQSDNPFAWVTLAHLLAKKTKNSYQERSHTKMTLIRKMHHQGFTHKQMVALFRFIDWVLTLPQSLDRLFWQEMSQLEEIKKMPYISGFERMLMEQGIEKGKQAGIAEVVSELLDRRFGSVPEWVQTKLAEADINSLKLWSQNIFTADKIESVFQ